MPTLPPLRSAIAAAAAASARAAWVERRRAAAAATPPLLVAVYRCCVGRASRSSNSRYTGARCTSCATQRWRMSSTAPCAMPRRAPLGQGGGAACLCPSSNSNNNTHAASTEPAVRGQRVAGPLPGLAVAAAPPLLTPTLSRFHNPSQVPPSLANTRASPQQPHLAAAKRAQPCSSTLTPPPSSCCSWHVARAKAVLCVAPRTRGKVKW